MWTTKNQGVSVDTRVLLPIAVFHSPWEKQIIKSSALLISIAPTEYQGVMTSVCRFLIFAVFHSPWQKQIQQHAFYVYSPNSLISGSRACSISNCRVSLPLAEANSKSSAHVWQSVYNQESRSYVFLVCSTSIRRISLPLGEANPQK